MDKREKALAVKMWTAQIEKLDRHNGQRYAMLRDSGAVSAADVIAAWRTDGAFRRFFNSLLAEAPYTAFRWETPVLTAATASKPFEFVLLDSPGLARRVDREAFAEFFDAAKPVVSFANLGKDAVLVVPCPTVEDAAYGHLAAFVRLAPAAQADALWQAVGEAMTRRVGAKPVWLSTAGGGVSWLHVRLDDRPKYYGYAPYRQMA
jgi:hypothetical protein